MEITIVPDRIPKVIVASHERSGTHFLMNTIADNFGYISEPWIDIDWPEVQNPYPAENFKAFLSQFQGRGVLNVFKTHFPFDFFEPVFDWLLTHFTVFYIYRQLEPCMASLCKHINGWPWKMGPEAENGEQLAGMEPSGALLRYQMEQKENCAIRWRDHQQSWFRAEGVHFVQYERLDNDFDTEVRKIGKVLDAHVTDIVRPSRGERVIISEEAIKRAG